MWRWRLPSYHITSHHIASHQALFKRKTGTGKKKKKVRHGLGEGGGCAERASEPGRGMFSGRAEPSGVGWLVGWLVWFGLIRAVCVYRGLARSDSRTTAVLKTRTGGGGGHRQDPPPQSNRCAGILFGAVRIPLRLCASLSPPWAR